MKGVDEWIDGILRWFGHVEIIEDDRIAKRMYLGKQASSHSVGWLWKRWIDTLKDYLKKKV